MGFSKIYAALWVWSNHLRLMLFVSRPCFTSKHKPSIIGEPPAHIDNWSCTKNCRAKESVRYERSMGTSSHHITTTLYPPSCARYTPLSPPATRNPPKTTLLQNEPRKLKGVPTASLTHRNPQGQDRMPPAHNNRRADERVMMVSTKTAAKAKARQ